MRRRFQVGPTTYEAREQADGWHVVAIWWEIIRGGEKDHFEDFLAGPTTQEQAERLAAEERERNDLEEAVRFGRSVSA